MWSRREGIKPSISRSGSAALPLSYTGSETAMPLLPDASSYPKDTIRQDLHHITMEADLHRESALDRQRDVVPWHEHLLETVPRLELHQRRVFLSAVSGPCHT